MRLHSIKRSFKISMAIHVEGMTMYINWKFKSDVQLKLTLSPLKLRNVLWILYETDMDEVLLTETLLKELDLEAIEHFEAVENDFNSTYW